ncbi:hypothetical protein BGZ51_000556, partial [Haplosporangium sp. Z 767]
LTSTVGGTDYWLTEARNVVKTQQDVVALWRCRPEEIKIFGLDLEQACVVGASALLPKEPAGAGLDQGGDAPAKGPSDATKSAPSPAVYYSLAVKQEAIYQPIFKYRRWLEEQKQQVPSEVTESISDIESRLPSLCVDDANFTNYVKEVEDVKERLDGFYNADQSVKSISGMPERSLMPSSRLLQTAYSIWSEARALGYIVVGVNEYYTSKKCPTYRQFVGQVEIRRLFCKTCKTYMHRDVIAGHNICSIVRGHLMHQRRPLYLQPMDSEGNYVWGQAAMFQTAASTSTSTNTSGQLGARVRKRAASVERPTTRRPSQALS